MRRFACLLGLALLVLRPSLSQAQCPGLTTQLVPFATERLTIGATPIALSPGVYQSGGLVAVMATATLEGGQVRYATVGTPSSTEGHPLAGTPPAPFTICGLSAIQNFRIVQVDTSATLTLTYHRTQ